MLLPKKFCVMTIGRSGSTSLMECLQQYDDIAVPHKNVQCANNELLHPKRVDGYIKEYSALSGEIVSSQQQLIECFYSYNTGYDYIGFKTMPNRHHDFQDFVARKDIQFITLVREDIPSTVASLIFAKLTGMWLRTGEKHQTTWRFNEQEHGKNVLSNLDHVLECDKGIRSMPDAIALTYEQLCNPTFSNQALNNFFARKISLQNPQPPTSGRAYVENWKEFQNFIVSSCLDTTTTSSEGA